MKSPRLSIVVPCFNEELILKETAGILIHLTNQLVEEGRVAADSYILFVNDGGRRAGAAVTSSARLTSHPGTAREPPPTA